MDFVFESMMSNTKGASSELICFSNWLFILTDEKESVIAANNVDPNFALHEMIQPFVK